MHVQSEVHAQWTAVERRGLEVVADEGRVLVGAGSVDANDAVRDAVAELGVGLRRLESRGRTLEDVYLGDEP